MNDAPQFNITVPDELPKELFDNFSKYANFVKKLDKYKLLEYYDTDNLATIIGTVNCLVGDSAMHLIQHEPMTGDRLMKKVFTISDMLVLQDDIPYTALEVHNLIKFSEMIDYYKNQLTKALQEKNISFKVLEYAMNAKTIHLDPKDPTTMPKVKEYINRIISQGVLPVHFSDNKLDWHDNISLKTLELQGLHIHIYSNQMLEERLKNTGNYNFVSKILELPWTDKQRKMLTTELIELPKADLKFLKDPGDDNNTILAYMIN
jgi:hypothetical protein